jgi:Mn-dependent DtxR family transcriptional regulator
MLKKEKGQVRAIDIVNHLGYSKPSVSVAMKNLEADGYISRDSSGHITLTDTGLAIAESVYERHDLLCNLFSYIGVSEDVAKEDACKVEHHISQQTFECLKKHFESLKKSC